MNNSKMNLLLLFTLLLIGFLDICNFFMPIPIFAPLFLHSQFLGGLDEYIRYLMLGTIIASYGFAQLFGGPFFGGMSDQLGRKKALKIALCLSILGCLLGGISLSLNWIVILYISRLILGFASGTIAIVMSITADHSPPSERAKNIGYVNIGIASGAVLGPLIGGHLASNHHLSFFGYATPFYAMGLLYFISLALILFSLPSPINHTQTNKFVYDPFSCFKNLAQAIRTSHTIRHLIIIVLFFQLAAESFYLIAPIVAVKALKTTPASIGNSFMVQGITALIVLLLLNSYISKRFTSKNIYICATFVVFVTMIFLPLSKLIGPFFIIPFIGLGFFGSLSWTHSNALFSQSTSEAQQGLIFGISQSLWAIGGVVGALLIGVVSSLSFFTASFIPVLFFFLSLFFAIVFLRKT